MSAAQVVCIHCRWMPHTLQAPDTAQGHVNMGIPQRSKETVRERVDQGAFARRQARAAPVSGASAEDYWDFCRSHLMCNRDRTSWGAH